LFGFLFFSAVEQTLRVYVSLPTTEEPTPAFVLQDMSDKTRPMLRIERTHTGPGRLSTVGRFICPHALCCYV